MAVYRDTIKPGGEKQWAVGDKRIHAMVTAVYVILRGSKRQTGQIQIDSYGSYSSDYVGADCGIDLYGSVAGNKILLKVSADAMDGDSSQVKFDFKELLI